MSAFRRWAFGPVDTAPMAALRIACGLLVVGWCLSLVPDVSTFLADDGVTSGPVDGTRGWWAINTGMPWLTLGVLLAAAVALALGWHTRVAAVLVAVGLLVVQRRDVYVLNSGDLLLRQLAIYVALMPAGETWSLDARRRGTSSPRAPWGLRMLQIQVSLLYFFSVVAKLHGDSWQNGTAVGRAVQLADLQRFLVPQGIATSVTASALLTYGTLVVEGALVFGLWLPRFRWWVMAAGVSIHLGIEATLLIGWFSLTVISCYLAFVPPETLRRVVGAVLERLGREPEPATVSMSVLVPAASAAPPGVAPPASVASPYPVGGFGQQQGHEPVKRVEVRLAPSKDVAADDGRGQPDSGAGEQAGWHDEAEPPVVVAEELPDSVDHEVLDAPAGGSDEAEGRPWLGSGGSAVPESLSDEPRADGEDGEDESPPAGAPGAV
ncbi:MAG TPA: HTTM domain-containing protein [Mycobacteriales bacterium]|nr:HTTM domain-containing protein [Mycobacteriales bacterium]